MNVSIHIRDELYEEFVRLVGDDIDKATEQAIVEWIERRKAFSRDSFFNLEPVATGVKEMSSNVDGTLYGEKG